jgi:hypothetical protein
MITSDKFIWLHLPKTGGTSMNRLMREFCFPGLSIDSDEEDSKHDSIALREASTSWRVGARRRFINARRLTNWLLSDWQHKRRHMGLPDLPFEPVRSGLFYSLRLGGVWVAADWWLQYFEVSDQVTALRLEHLVQDLNDHLRPLLPPGTPRFHDLPRENAKPSHLSASQPSFDEADLARIRVVNPRWSAWERSLYSSS